MLIDKFFLQLFTHIGAIISTGPLIMFIINYKFIKGYYWPLFVLAILAVLAELLNMVFVSYGKNTFPIFHAYTLVEFTLFSWFYILYFKTYINTLIFKVILSLFPCLFFIDYYVNNFGRMDVISASYESIALSGFSLYYFYSSIKTPTHEELLKVPVFWINTASLLYFSGNLFVFLFDNYLVSNFPEKANFLWSTVHSFLNMGYGVLMSIGIWKLRKVKA